MEAPSVEELETLKYPELRKLAKAAGLKGNLKADRLLRTLKAHFHPAVVTENSSGDSDGNSTLTDDTQGSLDDTEQVSICYVTNRRGERKKKIKAYSSPEMKNEIKQIQGEGAENDTEETSIPVSTSMLPGQQSEEAETRETKEDTAKITTRRRSKRNPSSGKKRRTKVPKRDAVSKAGSKPSTPNFKRMHDAHFKKMESIDKYLERKQKRLDAISSTIQDVKMLTKNSNQKTPGSNTKKSLQTRFSLLSPVPQTGFLFSVKTPANTRSAGKRSILVDKSGAKPSTYSSSKMNVRFSGATKDNEHKYSLVKTPARKSSTFMPNNGESRKSLPQSSMKATPATKETKIPAAITPFKFTAENIATPNNSKKMKFDLQASLSRPLGYQPHKGKLKPWQDTKENTGAVQSKSSILKNTYKQPHLPTRDTRRKDREKDRKNKREKTFGSRRGVAVP
ncbi:nucleolar and spindle-associated protein 1 isoform X2 [Ranitomeya variabilis]|uniref:nucleolar and spindle-associated protein 1 isoform X2 n=1 Tax=Ranitomeya variabilis TaxID=490064 RepID=UPI0040572213